MIVFWVVAGVLAAAAAGLILQRAARAASNPEAVDPTLGLYQRQLSEIDDLADRGLLGPEDRRVAHAEAARRLLTAADETDLRWSGVAPMRKTVLAATLLIPAAALALYLMVGAPGVPDQAFDGRLAAWRKADPSTLTPPEMAAVLTALSKDRPRDPELFRFLALVENASENPAAANRALRRAIELAPDRADLWEMLGETTVVQAGGDVTPQARVAFEEALKRDPKSATARFHLARADIAAGRQAQGLAAWRTLLADLPDGDPRRQALLEAIAEVEGKPAPAPAADPMAPIRAMVDGLAARLSENPDDPDGWVRLVRSYAVLGDTARREATLKAAQQRYAARPDILDALKAAAATEPMR
jgi:cytochrome c-type biogenesis protein CcmH